ncbi:hypothetical protein NHX12_012762 [Muraenolepis orangiensis]|uniref:TFIIS central domain-containing protein n=1 Tax=Muraenolepis orangiensis TaxID=630683 RepID=A0A9Q0I678_9TELE|nr:hypothetical protein NHX12_012762 [Muraenolepis orangiensis]
MPTVLNAPPFCFCFPTANKSSEHLEAQGESVPPVPQEPATAPVASSSIPVADTPLPQGSGQGATKKPPTSGGVSKKPRLDSPQRAAADPPCKVLAPTDPRKAVGAHRPRKVLAPADLRKALAPADPRKVLAPPNPAAPGSLSSRLPLVPAPKPAKGAFVIPKKQPAPGPLAPPTRGPGSVAVAAAPPSSSPAAAGGNETRTLPVAPAPIAPSSRPSQPNNQVRQSIQRSLAAILFKRVTDCEELDMSEGDVGKLVTSIEVEMFDIFRNTDSKYMNKYRTIMFNLKDPKNKGLLFRVMRGEISPFRLARMSQKDMQATKVPEPSAKESTEEQKRSVPPAVKSRPVQLTHISSVPDLLSCMLKDTTSEHKTHLFDLKCKICTGQMPEEEEPAQKRPKVSDSRDKRESGRTPYGKPPENPWRCFAGDVSPLRAPPDSPDMDSPPPNPFLEPFSRLVIDAPSELSIVESPASPVLESPASPVLESPASPIMDSPASPTAEGFKTKPFAARAYAPVVIPAVSTVTITRRDPRTAASRSLAFPPAGALGRGRTAQSQPVSYAALKVASSGPAMSPATPLRPPPMPKSILMMPSPSADSRLYQTPSRNMNSHSTVDGETSQFLANQTILWKGFLNMLSVAKFMTKGYVVSGSGETLKAELPDTIQIAPKRLFHPFCNLLKDPDLKITAQISCLGLQLFRNLSGQDACNKKDPLQVHIVGNGSHLRNVVDVIKTIVEVLQEVRNSDHHLIHEDGRIEKDTEEVKGIGQDIPLGTSLNGRVAIAKNGPHDAIQEGKENRRLPEEEILHHFHQNAKWELHLRSFQNHNSQVLRVILL